MKTYSFLFAVFVNFVANPSSQAGGAIADESKGTAAAPAWVLREVKALGVQCHTFESAAAKATVSYHLYQPEAYTTDERRRFPVLYWLHGTGGGAGGIAPLSAFFDRAIREGKIPPMLVVFPNGLAASMWCDSKDGTVPMETVVVKELMPHIDATFRTIAAREGRIIEGFSMGGYGAARLGFKHPDLFAAVSILAGGPLDLEFKGPRATGNPAERERILQTVYGGDMKCFKEQSPLTIAQQNAKDVRDATRIRIAVGTRDFTADLNRKFAAHLKQLGIPHTFTELPDVEHSTMQLFNALGERNWEFYRAALGPTAK